MGQYFKWVPLWFIAFIFPFTCAAQDLPDVAQGLQPFVAYHGGQLDKVSTLNGTLTVRIPLVSYPQKGSSLALSYSVIFNSFGYQDLEQCDSPPDPGGSQDVIPLKNGCMDTIQLIPTGIPGATPLGPRLVIDQQLFAGGALASEQVQSPQPNKDGRFYVIGPDNAEHPLAPGIDGYRSVDESGYLFFPASPPSFGNNNLGGPEFAYPGDISWVMGYAPGTIVDSKGNTYTANSITDRDGNTISAPNIGSINGSGYYTSGLPALDSAGRQIPVPVQRDASLCPTLTNAQFQPLSFATEWDVPGPNGTVPYIFCYAWVNLRSHFPIHPPNSGSTEYQDRVTMLQSIVLPNHTYWGFIYDSNDPDSDNTPTIENRHKGLGQLMTLIYPTGGSVNYTYTDYEGFCPAQHASGISYAGTSIQLFESEVIGRKLEDAQGNVIENWGYGIGSVKSPGGDVTVTHYARGPSCQQFETGEDVYQGDPDNGGVKLRSIVKNLTSYLVPGAPDLLVTRESSSTTTLEDGTTSSTQTFYAPGTTFGAINCDSNGGNCSTGIGLGGVYIPVGEPTETIYKDFDGSTILKQEATTYQWQQNPAYFTANLLEIPATVSAGYGNKIATTTYTYDESAYSSGGVRGHATTVAESLDLASGPAPTTHTGWNASGQKIYTIDANQNHNGSGHTTDYQYGQCDGSLISDTYNALNQHTSGTYDCNAGLLSSLTDPNGNTTHVSWDVMGRILGITYPAVQSGTPTTTFCYQDDQSCNASSPNTVVKTVAAAPDPNQTTTVVFDGFGREIHRYASDPQGQDEIDTTYDPDGRVSTISNPYRSTGDPTYGLTTTTYDALNRKLNEQEPGGSSLSWSYTGPMVDSYDEAGVHHQHTSDALGRLTKVMELGTSSAPLSLQTNYTYDPLGNLTSVVQHGATGETARSRSFQYDSLSRLITSTNPETGTICYGESNGSGCINGYDANGNLLRKTDANNHTTSYAYDLLNRLISRQTNDGVTRAQFYHYDWTGGPNGTGRLLQTTDDIHVASGFAYDALGHLTTKSDCLESDCSYSDVQLATYDLAGNLISFQYPDGRIVHQTWDSAGHLATISDATPGGGDTPYFSGGSGTGATYSPSGLLTNAVYGNRASESVSSNSRLQPCHVSASWSAGGSIVGLIDRQSYYNPSASSPCGSEGNNNGNIYSVVDNLQNGLSQGYSYDGLNRITSGSRSDGAYSHTYSYDSFGNLTVKDNLTPNSAVEYSIDPATNRLLRSHDGGVTWGDYIYDAAGTMTQSSDGISAAHTYTHNAVGQLVSMDGGGTASYLYGGLDERVFKQTPNGTTDYVYFTGQPIAERNNDGSWTDYIYANGQKIAKVSQELTHMYLSGAGAGEGFRIYQSSNFPISTGDKIAFRQFAGPSTFGGINIDGYLASGQSTYTGHTISDQNGQPADSDTQDGAWLDRVIDLSPLAGGQLSGIEVLGGNQTGNGTWYIDFADIAIVHADGSLTPIFNGQQVSFQPRFGVGGYNPPAVTTDNIDQPVHYYIDDHLGSTQMELSSGGWPVWSGQFTPFGQEIVSGQVLSATLGNQQPGDGTNMHYKFTGKERDAESGLDYFGARYYSSNMGRFMSPDPGKINLKHLANPQKWNKYAYVLNNPLSMIDPDGMEELWIQYRAFIPQANVGPIKGDGRTFSPVENASSRVSITMHIETDPAKNNGQPLLGYTQDVNSTHNNLTGNNTPPIVTQTPTATGSQDPVTGQVTLNVQMNVQSGDAMGTKASIRSDVNIGVNQAGTQATAQGTVSGSPAFEMNVAPQGGPTTNLPLQNASPNPITFIWNLPNNNTIKKQTPIQQPQ
jgi:RHS repeat-associated protein